MSAVDELDLEGGSPPPPPRPRRRRPHGPTAWVAAAGALVVAGVLVAPSGGVLIGATTGGVELGVRDLDLREAPTQVWRTGLDLTLEGQQVLRMIDDVVVTTGTTGLAGYDVADGDLLWEVAADQPLCRVGTEIRELVCVDSPGAEDAEIVRVEPGTGAVTRVARPGAWVAVGSGGGALVVLEGGVDVGDTGTGNDAGRLVRVDPDGSERWEIDTQAGWGVQQAQQLSVDMEIRGGLLTVRDIGLVVDVETGAEQADARIPDGYWLDDRTLLEAAETLQSGYVTYDVRIDGQVVAEDQHVVMSPDDDLGGLVDLRPTEESTGDVMNHGFTAVRTDTGEELWRTAPMSYPMARLEGVVELSPGSDGDRVHGLDVRSGEDLWTLPEGTSLIGGAAATLLMTDLEGTLAGLDVRTGEIRWTSDVDGFFGTSLDIPTGMVVVSGTDLVRIDWPR